MLPENTKPYCPDCDDLEIDRRGFIRTVGAAALVGGLLPAVPRAFAADKKDEPSTKAAKPAEALIKELYASLTPEKKADIVMPWDHGVAKDGKGTPTRMKMYNRSLGKNIGECYTKPQQELVERILRSIASDEAGYRQLTRKGTFDGSQSFTNCGSHIFGDPDKGKFAWVFSGHHLTVRCDGNSEEGAAFGGPMYYGHSPNGYSEQNVFNYQTKSVLNVFDALSGEQRKKAVIEQGNPGEGEGSIKFRGPGQAKPGIVFADLTKDQMTLIERVMRDVLSPYRKEDADEVMQIVKANGGMEKLHLAFYKDMKMNDKEPWHFWRLEGPGFVWNYRVLPHVHTFVNISSKL